MRKNIRHLIPFIVLLVLILLVYITNLHKELSLNFIRKEQTSLLGFVHHHPILSPLIFIGVYIVSVCLVLPDSTLLSLIGGLVFPFPLAVVYIVVAETIGAIIFFVILREMFKDVRTERPFFKKLRIKFKKHQASYLMFLRLSHVFPFWLTNVCAAYFDIRLKTFIWTCFLGVIPLSIILADAGRSLSHLFAKNSYLTIADIFTPEIKFALIAVGLLSLAPIIYEHVRERKK
jgi:uncharacterized membrane protein YdjX (TVP38/TMEM64 family)